MARTTVIIRLPRDKSRQLASSDGSHRHRHGFGGREPIGVVVATSVVANVIEVAEQEGHRAELGKTTSGCALNKMSSTLTQIERVICLVPKSCP